MSSIYPTQDEGYINFAGSFFTFLYDAELCPSLTNKQTFVHTYTGPFKEMPVFGFVKFWVCLKKVNISFEPEFGNPRFETLKKLNFSIAIVLVIQRSNPTQVLSKVETIW